jgi:bifunctional DNA-binding transcriptional regulator/antitoxin component of YhaV-PrlF toxin-antitoxin module
MYKATSGLKCFSPHFALSVGAYLPGVIHMQLTNDGQVTIPPDIRSLAGLVPGSEVEFKFDAGRVWLLKVPTPAPSRRDQVLSAIAGAKGCATANRHWRTDDILQMTRED